MEYPGGAVQTDGHGDRAEGFLRQSGGDSGGEKRDHIDGDAGMRVRGRILCDGGPFTARGPVTGNFSAGTARIGGGGAVGASSAAAGGIWGSLLSGQ